MAAKRKSRNSAKPARKHSPAVETLGEVVEKQLPVPDGLSAPLELATPVESAVPAEPIVPGEPDGPGDAPKSGPPARGRGGFTGVGQGRGAAPVRQYAFRRS